MEWRLPVFLARIVFGASWRAIRIAYAIYLGMILVAVVGSLGNAAETAGWMLILAIFRTTPAIPGLTVMLKQTAGVR